MNAVILILSDSRGTYIPRDFICDDNNEIAWDHCAAWGLTEENLRHWQAASDPNDEWYWEAWRWVCDHAYFTAENGDKYHLYQDGDLWGICYDKMTMEDKQNFGFIED